MLRRSKKTTRIKGQKPENGYINSFAPGVRILKEIRDFESINYFLLSRQIVMDWVLLNSRLTELSKSLWCQSMQLYLPRVK